jgi:hypothetical protein
MGNIASRQQKKGGWSARRTFSLRTSSPTSVKSESSMEMKRKRKSAKRTTPKVIDVPRSTQDAAPETIVQHSLLRTSQSDTSSPASPIPEIHVSPPSDGKVKRISNPTVEQLLLAAVKFGEVARNASLTYAIVGGVSAIIFGSLRATHSLDILYERTAPGPLFDNDPTIFGYGGLNNENPLILIYEDQGIALNLINYQDNKYGFPDLQGPTKLDGTPLDVVYDPEPTWDNQCVHPTDPPSVSVRVLLPRILLQQRLLHFPTRPNEGASDERKKKDVADIAVYLGLLFGTMDQSFKMEEAGELVRNVREVMRFAEKNGIAKGLEENRWRWIMIPIVEGDWREGRAS